MSNCLEIFCQNMENYLEKIEHCTNIILQLLGTSQLSRYLVNLPCKTPLRQLNYEINDDTGYWKIYKKPQLGQDFGIDIPSLRYTAYTSEIDRSISVLRSMTSSAHYKHIILYGSDFSGKTTVMRLFKEKIQMENKIANHEFAEFSIFSSATSLKNQINSALMKKSQDNTFPKLNIFIDNINIHDETKNFKVGELLRAISSCEEYFFPLSKQNWNY